MRVQGASPAKLFTLVLLEGLFLAIFGCLIGGLIGHVAAYVIAGLIGSTLTGAR